jgi:hypothetical protein
MARSASQRKGAVLASPPDPEEQAAVARAAGVLKELVPGVSNPEAVATSVISAWIIERVRLSTGRISGLHSFALGDSHLRGSLEGQLARAAEALSHLPPDKPFFELSRDQVVDVLAVGCILGRETGALLNDEIPF